MPNIIINKIKFNGDKKSIDTLLNSIRTETTNGTAFIDFNNIVPMPEALDVEESTDTYRAIVCFLTEKLTKVPSRLNTSSKKILEETVNYMFDNNWATSIYRDLKRNYVDELDTFYELGKMYVDNYKNYGATTWYEWCIHNWGTKWNALDSEYSSENNELTFTTAWDGVPNLIHILAKNYPDVSISYNWGDEDYFGNALGEVNFADGKITYENIPEDLSDEAYDMATKFFGCDKRN